MPDSGPETAVITQRRLLSSRGLVAVAMVGLVLTLGYALAPVHQETVTFSFRPTPGPHSDLAVASLALAQTTPDTLRARFPCDEPDSSFGTMDVWAWWSAPGAEHSPLRYRGLGDALLVSFDGTAITAVVGEQEVVLPTVLSSGCVIDVQYGEGVLSVAANGDHVTADVGPIRFAEATFEGPAASSRVSSVVVETHEIGSSPSGVQVVLLLVALVALGIVAREVAVRRARRRPGASEPLLARLWASIGWADGAAVGILLIWWFLVPASIDDAWTGAIQRRYDSYGDFSGIFVNATAAPIGYWLNWLQHQWLALADSALLARAPAVVLGVGIWAGLRSIGRSLGVADRGRSVWLMAGVFTVGFGAWGVTLRPEPVIAALVVASLGFALRFRRGYRGWTIVGWSIVIALGLSAHPTGILVLAPVLAAWRDLVEWARSGRETRTMALVSAVFLTSLTAALLLLDTNLGGLLRRLDAVRASGLHSQSLLDELARYDFMDQTPYATVLGRLTVAFLLIGVVVFLTRARPRRDARSLIGWSTLVGMGLLALVPSKWPVHFAGLVGLTALLLAVELARLDSPRLGPGVRRLWARGARRSMAMLVVVAGLIAYAWSISLPWNAFDLRTIRWWSGLDLSSVVTWLALGVGLIVAVRLHGSGRFTFEPAESVVLVASVAAVVFTVSTVVADAVRTEGWTFTGQNVASLAGRDGCGLGDEIVVPVPGSLRSLAPAPEPSTVAADATATQFGFPGDGTFADDGFSPSSINDVLPVVGMDVFGSWMVTGEAAADANVGSYRSDWYALEPGATTTALMVMGRLDGSSGNGISVQWGRATTGGVASRGVVSAGDAGYFTDWSLRLFEVPPGADRARVLLRDATIGAGDAWVASSAPLAVVTATIDEVVAPDGPDVMVTPPLGQYFPCVEVPVFADAVVRAPGMMILMWDSPWQTAFAAAALSDRYFRVPVTLDPPVRDLRIGAHLGDAENFIFVSQEYLTGRVARAAGEFARVVDD